MNYLNLFEHYRHEASIPLENNLTRILARIIKGNYYVADLLFRLINNRLIESGYGTIYDDFDDQKINVDIQKSIGELKQNLNIENDKTISNKIIGIALTAENINFDDIKTKEATDQQRPDIYVFFDNYHFIFEVKKTKEDCSQQLKEYLESLNADKIVSIKWDDIISILEKSVNDGYGDLIINDYLDYIRCHCPKLFDYRSLKYSCSTDGSINYKDFVENRIELAYSNIELNKDKNYSKVEYPYLFIKNNSFQQRVAIDLDEQSSKLCFKTWLADTGEQMRNFSKYYENNKFELKNGRQKTNLYVKFANCGNWLYTLSLNKDFDGNTDIFHKLYEITGRKKGDLLRKSLEEIVIITNSNISLKNNIDVNEYINRNKDKDISVGICVEDYIDLKELVDLDVETNKFNKNMNANEDEVAKYINDYIVNNLIFEK